MAFKNLIPSKRSAIPSCIYIYIYILYFAINTSADFNNTNRSSQFFSEGN